MELISVPTGRFVAAATLLLQKTFVVAAASLSHRAELPGVAQSPLQSTYLHDIRFKQMLFPTFGDEQKKERSIPCTKFT